MNGENDSLVGETSELGKQELSMNGVQYAFFNFFKGLYKKRVVFNLQKVFNVNLWRSN